VSFEKMMKNNNEDEPDVMEQLEIIRRQIVL
jgi:hypothetical protein